ncbi:MAG: Pr6Pr family membrane protein [Bacilli bacterium]|jgi:hypothetical protein|nr:Pr6Pr family membrane protein [Bacilli bacterium]MDD3349010.1 Pr6Pr family membrane protein [Bacilli bacterium]MDD4056606.1 Pr6Pr family membrane protein [Bacilli bacterium]MDY0208645.1 Pr6Pr family membrane protein [Bacilli bacterium]
MRIDNKLAIFIYRFVLFSLGVVGILLSVWNPEGAFAPQMFLYYTIQTNIFCVLILLYMIGKEFIFKKEFSPGIYKLKSLAMIAITITCLVYAFVLLPAFLELETPGYDVLGFKDLIIHFIIPIGFLIDYFLFDQKGTQTWSTPLFSLVYLCLYGAFIFTYAKLGSPYSSGANYPYEFINIDTQGLNQVLQNIIVLIFVTLVIGFVYYGLDKLLGLGNRQKVEVIDISFFRNRQR